MLRLGLFINLTKNNANVKKIILSLVFLFNIKRMFISELR